MISLACLILLFLAAGLCLDRSYLVLGGAILVVLALRWRAGRVTS